MTAKCIKMQISVTTHLSHEIAVMPKTLMAQFKIPI